MSQKALWGKIWSILKMPSWPNEEFNCHLLLPALYLSSESCTLNCIVVQQSSRLSRITSPCPNHKLMVRIPGWEVGSVCSNPSGRRENWIHTLGPEALWTTANCVKGTQSLLPFLEKQLERQLKSEPVPWENSWKHIILDDWWSWILNSLKYFKSSL